MKAIIDFSETANGNVELNIIVPAGIARPKEVAYMNELIALLQAEAPKFGQARGAKGWIRTRGRRTNKESRKA